MRDTYLRDTYLRDTRSHLNCRDCVADLNERTERAEKRRWREKKKGGSRAHRRALILLFTFSALAARAGLLSRLTDFIRMQIRGCARARLCWGLAQYPRHNGHAGTWPLPIV